MVGRLFIGWYRLYALLAVVLVCSQTLIWSGVFVSIGFHLSLFRWESALSRWMLSLSSHHFRHWEWSCLLSASTSGPAHSLHRSSHFFSVHWRIVRIIKDLHFASGWSRPALLVVLIRLHFLVSLPLRKLLHPIRFCSR